MSDFPLLMFLSPQVLLFIGGCIIAAVWIFFGWIDPISKLRDPNKPKGGAFFQMLILGIIPLALLIYGFVTGGGNHPSSATGSGNNNVGQNIPWVKQNVAPAAPPAAAPQPQMPSAPLSQTNVKPSGAVPV